MAARPERVPAEEVRQRMLDAGRELALEAGAALTIEHLRLEEIIQRARVPRSSAYRLWPYREDYTDDLLCYLAGEGSWFSERPVHDPETFTIVEQVLADNTELLGTLDGRRALFCEIVRLTADHNYAVLTESAPWRLHMALVATLGSTRGGEARRRVAAALEDAQQCSRESLVAALGYLCATLGFRLRDPAYTLDHVQLAGGLLVQSLALRNVQVQSAVAPSADGPGSLVSTGSSDGTGTPSDTHAAPAAPEVANRLLNEPVPGPGLTGPVGWSLAARAYLGLVDAFLELDPDFTPPAP